MESVLDARTVRTLHSMLNRELLSEMVGTISAGKEANVYLARLASMSGYPPGTPAAVKVYKIDTQTSKWMMEYLRGDYRFRKQGHNISKIIFSWTLKEFRNLSRAHQAGVMVPQPIAVRNNVLVMQFIGEDEVPAPRLKDVRVLEDPQDAFEQALGIVRNLYERCGLVHGDFSEFNVLYLHGELYAIDISQGVTTQHPKARFYLARDLKNLFNYFERWDVDLPDVEETFYQITETESEGE
ncbi:MAG: RIO-type serine/threonine-protein kinase Rio1 [Promethearchaeota archaeon]